MSKEPCLYKYIILFYTNLITYFFVIFCFVVFLNVIYEDLLKYSVICLKLLSQPQIIYIKIKNKHFQVGLWILALGKLDGLFYSERQFWDHQQLSLGF